MTIDENVSKTLNCMYEAGRVLMLEMSAERCSLVCLTEREATRSSARCM